MPLKRKEDLNILEKLYIFEVVRGLFVTGRHLIANFIGMGLRFAGIRTDRVISTYQYPEEIRPYPPRYRGRHRLTLKTDGSVRCTSCFLCATACPARCIYIEPAEHDDPNIEKFPHRYEIDTLLCVYCGYCVDACPVDAIRMDTGIHPEIYPPDPRLYIEDKETLMNRSRIIEDFGHEALLEAHRKRMKEVEFNPFLANDAPLETLVHMANSVPNSEMVKKE